MIQDWEVSELEEKLGQGVKLAQMLIETPDDCDIWEKLKAWSTEHKNYVSESYNPERPYVKTPIEDIPEAVGYDVSQLDGNTDSIKFKIMKVKDLLEPTISVVGRRILFITNTGVNECDGFRCFLPGFDDFKYAVHMVHVGYVGWVVTELSTGRRMPIAKPVDNKEMAVRIVYANLSKIGLEKLTEKLSETPKIEAKSDAL
jgi:hypothetical protein